jgi:CRISPR system Cascade subunit CasA
MAALARDEVESFPALRPHQGPAWHMFLMQLAALALHRAGKMDIPEQEDDWLSLVRGLTPGFAEDEPWCLVVDDRSKPAFLQPPVPADVKLANPVPTPDVLDLLITARNHDLKQKTARQAEAQDWVFALVSLQTSEGYGGKFNQGIARMNGGSSSRPMLGLGPLPRETGRTMAVRFGAWFRRDVGALLESRDNELERHSQLDFPAVGGVGLLWLASWLEGAQLQLKDLDIWFIEICRRIRLKSENGVLSGWKGTSKATRINAKHLNGALGDPWSPVHKTDNKSFTLAGRDFDYGTLTELMLSGDWELPLLARPTSFEQEGETLALIAGALARGNSKTEGFKSRILPLGGKIFRALSLEPKREELHKLALSQIDDIGKFKKAIAGALALAAAGGDWDKRKKEHYTLADDARARFDRAVDDIFFPHLWARFEAQEKGEEALKAQRTRFAEALHERARTIFQAAVPGIPCAGIFRPRAEARARRSFNGAIWRDFPELFPKSKPEETDDAACR